MKFKSKVFFF